MEYDWIEAIKMVLDKEGMPMSCNDILKKIIENGYRTNLGKTPYNSVNMFLNQNTDQFEKVGRGVYALVETPVASVTAGKSSAATKTGSDISLHDLVLACIEAIGRKYFDAKELYAFAPIFKLCAAVPGDLEDALKKQLDELVKDGVLDALSDGCYSKKS